MASRNQPELLVEPKWIRYDGRNRKHCIVLTFFYFQKNKYPWMAALVDSNGNQFCGGTLVASKYVVTAAHCMFYDQNAQRPVPLTEIKVRLGDHDLAATGETSITEKTISVSTRYNHESYAPAGGSLNNDITVLELAEEVDINTYIPACLAQTSDTDTFYGKTAQVSRHNYVKNDSSKIVKLSNLSKSKK